jgi:hypothetical protein
MNDSQQAGADVARALGFDPKEFLEINLRFRAGDLLVVDAQQLVIGDRLKKVADEIVNRKFVCREIKDDAAPVAVPAEQPPKPSGVAAAAATAADVARSVAETPDERHDAATCCGERQEPDVGEGWEEVKLHDTIKLGDQIFIKALGVWQDTCGVGLYHKTADRYRRRVTPVAQEPQARLAATWAAAHRVVVEALAAEQEKVKKLRSEVERLRLTKEEQAAIKEIVGQNEGYLPSSVTFGGTTAESLVVRKMLYRLGGGE